MGPTETRWLLLTGTAPGDFGVGSIFLSDLERFLSVGSLFVVHVVDGVDVACETTTAFGNSLRVLRCRIECRPQSRFGLVGKAFDWLRMTLANRRRIDKAVRACVEYARQQRVEEVWAILDTPASIALAAPVADALGLPLRVTVWDDIEHNVGYFQLDRFTARECRRNFDAAIRRADGLAVIGETMQHEYRRRYGKDSVILRHGLKPALRMPGMHEPGSAIRIGFAGSVTARSAFNCLLQALDSLGWSIDGREITLVLMGQRFDLLSAVPRRIECLGYLATVDEVVSTLSGCTVNYLPQPFESRWRPFAQWSFPSKLTTYLAAGAPVLLHAPPHASLPAFFERYPFGALVTQLDAQAVGEALRELCGDPTLRREACDAGAAALTEMFSVERFRNSFAEFLGIELQTRDERPSMQECKEAPAPCAASPAS